MAAEFARQTGRPIRARQPSDQLWEKNELEDMQGSFQVDVFAEIRTGIAALAQAKEATVTAGHLDIGAGIWLSADPAGRAMMRCQPAQEGFTLELENGDSGAWACLGMRLLPAALTSARYLGLLVALHGGSAVSFTPTLRYFRTGEPLDVAAARPVVLAGGAREHLAYIPIDPALLDGATGCELNLFFHSNEFTAEIARLEPLLIL